MATSTDRSRRDTDGIAWGVVPRDHGLHISDVRTRVRFFVFRRIGDGRVLPDRGIEVELSVEEAIYARNRLNRAIKKARAAR